MSGENGLPIGIVGGGIGGLALAGALEKTGRPFVLLEQAPALTEVGAGIQIASNGVHVLRFLGIEDQIASTGSLPIEYHARDWKTGETLYRQPRNPLFEEKYGAPYYQIHRADLLNALRSAVSTTNIRLGQKVTALDALDDRVRLTTANGETIVVSGVVGADGVHSTVRNALISQDKPTFAGIIVYRLTAPLKDLPGHFSEIGSSTFHGPHGHATVYPISGGSLINCALSYETDAWETESWSLECGKDEVFEAFDAWYQDVHHLIEKTSRINKWALFDRAPFPTWSKDRVTLLGDAAHPPLPFLAQGACMAIEDAYILAACLKQAGNFVPQAFADYQALRWQRTANVMQAARERVVSMHEASPLKTALRNLNYWVNGMLGRPGKRFNPDWIYEKNVVAEMPIS